jgi:exodeoxyribonuclease VII small subunit
MATPTKTKLPNLEQSLTEITTLIDKMEKGDLTLDESLTQFERGITLIKHAQKILQVAEHKVQILMQENNQEILTTFENKEE